MVASRAIYAGTFDLFTNGHYEILKRALRIFDKITVLVAVNSNKNTLFSQKERVGMLQELFKDDKDVEVDWWDGLIIEYAKQKKISSIIRGLRPTGDFEAEFQIASMNKRLDNDIDTVFFMTAGDNYFISSSMIKEVLAHGGDISEFVPSAILEFTKKWKKTKEK